MELTFIQRKLPASIVQPEKFKKTVERDLAQDQARQYVGEALLTLVTLMRTDPDSNMKFKCAKEIINRAYGAPKQIVENTAQAADIIEVLAHISSSGTHQITNENPVIDVLTQP